MVHICNGSSISDNQVNMYELPGPCLIAVFENFKLVSIFSKMLFYNIICMRV